MLGRRLVAGCVAAAGLALAAVDPGLAGALTTSSAVVVSPDWNIVGSPNAASTQNRLYDISCTSTSFCMAVGSYMNGAEYQTLTEEWTGSGWSIVSSPNTGGTSNQGLDTVSCTSTSFCMAVGFYYNSANYEQTLAEQWDGSTWRVVSSPNTSATAHNGLNELSCTRSTFCVAAGVIIAGSLGQTLIQEWDGSGWNVVPSPNVGSSSEFASVSCASATFCMAVGDYRKGSIAQTLAERWDGGSWTIVSSPDTSAPPNNSLHAISCRAATFCMAADLVTSDLGLTHPRMVAWNGTSWNFVTSPATSANDDYLADMSCTSIHFCMAVGVSSNSPAPALIEEWDGTIWNILSASRTADNNDLLGVSCVGTGFCLASGFRYNEPSEQTLIEAWTGTSTYADASARVQYDGWRGVADATASGQTYRVAANKGARAALAFSWDSVNWITRKGPDQGIASVAVDGVSRGTIDLYAPTEQSFSQAYSGLGGSNDSIVITLTGTKNAASTGTNVVVDAFELGSETDQENSASITYDTWVPQNSSSATAGRYHLSGTAGAKATLRFNGTAVDWITMTGPSSGMAAVSIDGASMGTVDLYTANAQWRVAKSYGGLASGSHTIVVTALGTRSASSAGTQVVVDGFAVHA